MSDSNSNSPGSGPSRRVNNYELLELIGSGGMSRVYRGRKQGEDADVAIKVIRIENVAADYERRLRREPEVQRALGHDNIVRMIDWFREGDEFFLVMEYVDGRSMSDLIHKESGPLPFQRARGYLRQVIGAIGQLHELGIIHRDIKPSNIMVGWNDDVKLADFGIAKYKWEQGRTRTQGGLGTPEYMSPEQARGTDIDHRTDIYSLGITLYEMLTARKPYTRGEDTPMAYAEVINSIMREPLPDPRAYQPGIPAAMVRLLNKATAKNPDERFQNVYEFLGALEVVDHDEDVSADTVVLGDSAVVPQPESQWEQSPPPSRPRAATGGALQPPPHRPGERRAEPDYVDERSERRGTWFFWLVLALMVSSVAGYFGYQYYQDQNADPQVGETLTQEDAVRIVNRVAGEFREYAMEQNPDALTLLYAPSKVGYYSIASASRDEIRSDAREFYRKIVETKRFDVETRKVTVENDSTISSEWIIAYERVLDDGQILRGRTSNDVTIQRVDNEWLITRQKTRWIKSDNIEPEPEPKDTLEVIDIDTTPLRPSPPVNRPDTTPSRPPLIGPELPDDSAHTRDPEEVRNLPDRLE